MFAADRNILTLAAKSSRSSDHSVNRTKDDGDGSTDDGIAASSDPLRPSDLGAAEGPPRKQESVRAAIKRFFANIMTYCSFEVRDQTA